MNRFTERIMLAKLDGSYLKVLNHFERIPLMILDDFGLTPLDHQMKLALLQILEDRYARKSIIITSQLPVSKWHEYLSEPTLADYPNKIIMRIPVRFSIVSQFPALKY
jgi:DNA replication protein DnaC